MKPMKTACALMVAAVFWPALPAIAAEAVVLQTDALTVRHGTARVESGIAGDFAAFAGSEANAQSLVTGLRSGTPITLSTPAAGGGAGTTLIVDTPTRPMGYGNVFISLGLARQQLASHGITDPTAQEIQAALTGGTLTTADGQSVTLNGVLTQRADGMGWGEIAKAQGTNLGQVVSGLKGANTRITTAGAAGSGAGAAGITTATGAQARTLPAAAAQGNAARTSAQGRGVTTGSGIVTATGSRPAVGAGMGAGASGNAAVGHGSGIVTGAGTAASVQGGARGAALGKGHARP
jgi:hypothetical protein